MSADVRLCETYRVDPMESAERAVRNYVAAEQAYTRASAELAIAKDTLELAREALEDLVSAEGLDNLDEHEMSEMRLGDYVLRVAVPEVDAKIVVERYVEGEE